MSLAPPRRARLPAILAILGMAGALGLVPAVCAQSLFEKLVMPGELVQGHAKLEKDCKQCHESFSRHTQARLCLDCHKKIASDIAEKTGFHGRKPGVAGTECRHCHTDHKGRQADIVGLDPETFDHAFTDFALKGAHATAPCQACHKPGVAKRDAPGTCTGCHQKDEPHQGRLGNDCAVCHALEHWRPAKTFDHAKTRFPLDGAHEKVACTTCHAGEQWKGLGTACVDCHRLTDKHGGRFGPDCKTCHSTAKWQTVAFDHDKATKFPLRGEHRKVTCESCHTGDLHKDKLPTACVACHKKEDPHNGQLGERCGSCHDEHSWRKKVAFDHDLSRFPLIGQHVAVPCESCHEAQTFKGTSTACKDCHEDKQHRGRLGPACERCHNPNGWALWQFDHARQARFPLTGAHAGVSCHACHTSSDPARFKLPTDCYGCHSGDDKHRGAFGRSCALCHATTAFSEIRRVR